MICRKFLQIGISESLAVNQLHEDHELNTIDNNVKCFDDQISLNLSEERELKDCKSVRTNNAEPVEPPEDYRTLPVYATYDDILHPGTIFMMEIISKLFAYQYCSTGVSDTLKQRDDLDLNGLIS